MDPIVFVALVWFVLAPVFLVLWLIGKRKLRSRTSEAETAAAIHREEVAKLAAEHEATKAKYSAIISEEAEVARLQSIASALTSDIDALRKSYAEKRAHFDRLESQVAIYDERLAFAELGIYEPHFDFTDSEEFKAKIVEVRDRQKAMISAKQAALCPTEWTVEGSKAKGATMINRQMRLTMRAFNNECEAAIANVRWNNVVAMEKRILSAAASIDKENTSMNLTLNDRFVALKIEELRLTHEYREQLKREKDERAEMARAEKEEKKLLAEAEAAEREEAKYQALLEKARKEANGDGNAQRIAELEATLAAAHLASERARAMAEMTKSGYVYIISNVGSFGDDVVKIGLTRRLDPDDRVRELGDASVPFSFDTHAMIYSDAAPALEAALQKEFAEKRINMSNFRKEFFRVALEDVEAAVARLAPTAVFFKDREAQEWHETLARRNASLLDMQSAAARELPASI
ncbi:T5orf172 domain-containing protein [Gemmobacter caeni]|uniref:T5orf172 domain-containing protein n=1 Tax=Gemmobacter caeni TaxID=589035 RepID=A0A2T6ATW5_9RHOB|nr:DUF4041 domain-containing protein [Gemmobacter caeni]PTX47259.1 T5orf172 domain-containing protein [Gemmobacter caeni]TWI96498.1 T5orf172 domain-containing protein [Gemmobacter caeni]